ncbi:hypothetical protein GCM10011608_09660 [Micromonospora sonchi]|uniref:Uncharacterized protein n=1 Tax=Micromonospora sonchi TaxID=1763543 RepID=A0A917TKR5_9ACTN|nr:hypothetical protein [Micromonospora sonchi]GGM26932.1 hypothetical protein GCM10011608_09660 [Micromonospora sonchi]
MTATTMPPVERFRRRPTTVDTMLWDGTPARAQQIRAWVGDHRFWLDDATPTASVWNDQEHEWFPVPVGHRVVRGVLGEFYAVSPDAIQATYRRTLVGALVALLRRIFGGKP